MACLKKIKFQISAVCKFQIPFTLHLEYFRDDGYIGQQAGNSGKRRVSRVVLYAVEILTLIAKILRMDSHSERPSIL